MIERVAIYARVSTEKAEQETSLEDQQRRLRSLAARKGWEVFGVFVDVQSGRHTSPRPEFMRMIAAAERRAFDAVLITARDRWARNHVESAQMQDRLEALGVRVVDEATADLVETLDPRDPAGWLNNVQQDVFAGYFSRLNGSKTSKAIASKQARGLHWGDVPFGYRRPVASEPMVLDEEEATVVATLFERYATGVHSYADLARWMNERGYRTRAKGGGRPFTNSSVRVILRNPIYVGEILVGRRAVRPGAHPPIVSRALFDRVQGVRPRAPREGTSAEGPRVYLVQGIARHASCTGPLWASTSNRGKYARPVYRCAARQMGAPEACARVTREAEDVDALIATLFSRLELPPSWQAQVAEESLRAERGPDPEAAAAELAELQSRLERTRTALLDGLLPYERGRSEIRALEARIGALARPMAADAVLRAGDGLTDLRELWPHMLPEERRAAVRSVLSWVELDLDGPAITGMAPRPEYEPVFAAIASVGGAVQIREPRQTDEFMLWWTRGGSNP